MQVAETVTDETPRSLDLLSPLSDLCNSVILSSIAANMLEVAVRSSADALITRDVIHL
jgi:hypothetical protein